MRTLGVLPSVMNQIAPPSLKLMLNTSVSDDIPPIPERTLPFRAVATARLSVAGAPTLGSWGSPWPSHHLNWIRINYPSQAFVVAVWDLRRQLDFAATFLFPRANETQNQPN